MVQHKQAFTLIELLVVVLIMGILAAVAWPSYTLAISKTRFAKLRSTVTAFMPAIRVYYSANGKWPNNFEELDIDLPRDFSSVSVDSANCRVSDEMYCCLIGPQGASTWNPAASCGMPDGSFTYYYMFKRGLSFCVAKITDPNSMKLCQSFGGVKAPWTAIPTPVHNTGSVAMYYLD